MNQVIAFLSSQWNDIFLYVCVCIKIHLHARARVVSFAPTIRAFANKYSRLTRRTKTEYPDIVEERV